MTAYQFHSESASAGQKIIDNLYNQIFKQRIIRDASLGIKAQLIEVNGKPMYLRDATNVDSKPLPAEQIAIAERGNAKMMALNYLLAYQRLAIEFKLPADDFIATEQTRILEARATAS